MSPTRLLALSLALSAPAYAEVAGSEGATLHRLTPAQIAAIGDAQAQRRDAVRVHILASLNELAAFSSNSTASSYLLPKKDMPFSFFSALAMKSAPLLAASDMAPERARYARGGREDDLPAGDVASGTLILGASSAPRAEARRARAPTRR